MTNHERAIFSNSFFVEKTEQTKENMLTFTTFRLISIKFRCKFAIMLLNWWNEFKSISTIGYRGRSGLPHSAILIVDKREERSCSEGITHIFILNIEEWYCFRYVKKNFILILWTFYAGKFAILFNAFIFVFSTYILWNWL